MMRVYLYIVLGILVVFCASFVWHFSGQRMPSVTVTPEEKTTTAQGLPTSATTSSSATVPITQSPSPTERMRLTFSDEFDTFSRYTDAQGNTTCKPGGTGTWQTVYNFCSRTNPGNDEAEVYTDPSFFAYLKKISLAEAQHDEGNPFSVKDGVLAIEAKPASAQVTGAVGQWAHYTSGLITTQFSHMQKYGYFEMRAKLPVGKGLWPAFWLLPEDETWPPEIDAMEAFGDRNSKGEGGRTWIHYGSHALNKDEGCGEWYNTGVDITADFHTYGVDIEKNGITYYFDGKPYATCKANSAANQRFYMLVNLAVGGKTSWPSTPDDKTPWPAVMYVDYVRAYQK